MSPALLPCQGHPTCPEPSPRAVDPTAPEVVVGIAREVRGVDAAISGCGCNGSWVWMQRFVGVDGRPDVRTGNGLRQRAGRAPMPLGAPVALPQQFAHLPQ